LFIFNSKITTTLHIFNRGIASDNVDEYVRIEEFIAIECFKKIAIAVVEIFGDKFFRHFTEEDILHHLQLNELHGFPMMFGSINCIHWIWKNCSIK